MTKKEWQAPEGYWDYHERVVAAVRANMLKRWGHPTTHTERDKLAMAVRFFDVECTYEDDFKNNADAAEVAESNIECADWE